MDDPTTRKVNRLPSIKQILTILGAGVLLFPGLCLAVGLNTGGNSGGVTVMIVLAAASVLFTVGGVVLFLVRAIRDFLRH
jgi:hypothetical protein